MMKADHLLIAGCGRLVLGTAIFCHEKKAVSAAGFCRYNSRAGSKKGLVGIGVPKITAAKSRNRKSCGFFHSGFRFGGPNVGPQGRRLNSSAVVPVRQPVRAASLIGVEVAVFKLTTSEANMARTQSRTADAGATSSFSPDREAMLRDVHADAQRLCLAVSGLLALLQGCTPDHPLSAGGLLALLEPVAGGLDVLRMDLGTAANAALQ
jgi:hypothetical protein